MVIQGNSWTDKIELFKKFVKHLKMFLIYHEKSDISKMKK